MRYPFLKLLIMLLCLLFPLQSLAENGDKLVVIESLVNVRAAPTADSESLLKLKKGRNVIEMGRQNNWVKVELHRTDTPTGWIHQSLLDKSEKTEEKITLTSFDKFKQRFEDQNEVIKKQNAIINFTEVTHKENGDIELLATEYWLNSDIEKRNTSLSEVFKLWSHYVPVGSSISIQVVDDEGERYTLMMR